MKNVYICLLGALIALSGCAQKQTDDLELQPQKQYSNMMSLEELKNVDASFLDDPAPLQPSPNDEAKQVLEQLLQDQSKTGQPFESLPAESLGPDNKQGNQESVIFTEEMVVVPPRPAAEASNEIKELRQKLAKTENDLAKLRSYAVENRDRIGENRHLIRRIKPELGTGGVVGYKSGQTKLSQSQQRWLDTNIVQPFKTGKISNIEITGYVDEVPTKRGSKYTLEDFSETRANMVRNYLATKGVVTANFAVKKGGVTDENGNNRQVKVDYIFTGN